MKMYIKLETTMTDKYFSCRLLYKRMNISRDHYYCCWPPFWKKLASWAPKLGFCWLS